MSTVSCLIARRVVAGARALRRGAAHMAEPSTLRRAQARALRIVTVVAGH